MPTVSFIQADGARSDITIADGTTLMLAATAHGIPGLIGECGGNAMCATCHVYIDGAWASRLRPPRDDEDALLDDTADERRPTSRLSCQITITSDLDGLVVHLPHRQT